MHHRMFVRRIVVLGTGPEAARTRTHIQSHRRKFFELVHFEAPPRSRDAGSSSLDWLRATRERRIWGVVDAGGKPYAATDEATSAKLLDLKLRGVRVFDELAFWEHQLGRINPDLADARWLTFDDGFASGWLGGRLKWATDILVSLGMLILTLPLMLITALLIRMDSSGPVLTRQEQVGLYGKNFVLFKFRSMSANAEQGGRPAGHRNTIAASAASFVQHG